MMTGGPPAISTIHLVVIDGIADLIRSANDETESIAIVDELYRLAGIYNTYPERAYFIHQSDPFCAPKWLILQCNSIETGTDFAGFHVRNHIVFDNHLAASTLQNHKFRRVFRAKVHLVSNTQALRK